MKPRIHVPFVAWKFNSEHGREISTIRTVTIAHGQGPDWWLRRVCLTMPGQADRAACLDVNGFFYGTPEGIRSAIANIGGTFRGDVAKLCLADLDRIRFKFPLSTGFKAELELTMMRGPSPLAIGDLVMVATFEINPPAPPRPYRPSPFPPGNRSSERPYR